MKNNSAQVSSTNLLFLFFLLEFFLELELENFYWKKIIKNGDNNEEIEDIFLWLHVNIHWQFFEKVTK